MATAPALQQTNLALNFTDTPQLTVAPPMLPGDSLDSVTIYVRGVAFDVPADGLDTINIEMYACNTPPRSAAEARAGLAVAPLTAVPTLTSGVLSSVQYLLLTIPILYKPTIEGRYIALILSGSVAAKQFTGVAYLKWFRLAVSPSNRLAPTFGE